MANTREFDIHQNVCRAGFGDINLPILERPTNLVDDLYPLLGWVFGYVVGWWNLAGKIKLAVWGSVK